MTEGVLMPTKKCRLEASTPAARQVAMAWVFPQGMGVILIELKYLGLPSWQPHFEEEINRLDENLVKSNRAVP